MKRWKTLWITAAACVMSVVAVAAPAPAAQRSDDDYRVERDRRGGYGYSSNAYNHGYREGYSDARQGHKARRNAHKEYRGQEKKAYREGYDRGYRAARYSGDRDGWWGRGRDDDHRDNDRDGGWWGRDRDRNDDWNRDRDGNYGYGSFGIARQNGYYDGQVLGQRDRQTGHSFRPTEHKAYKDADRGYSSRIGGKDQFKQAYRNAYLEGYQRAYGRTSSRR